jgi:hypothetical protein
MNALALFEADHRLLLPRVRCYFDDILGFTFGDHVGERLAISEFNESHQRAQNLPNLWSALLCSRALFTLDVGEQ